MKLVKFEGKMGSVWVNPEHVTHVREATNPTEALVYFSGGENASQMVVVVQMPPQDVAARLMTP